MASKQTPQGEIVVKYLEQYTNMSSHGLSRLIYKDYPLMFTTPDAVRGVIRYYRQSSGIKNAKSLDDKRFVGTGLSLGEPVKESYEPMVIPKANDRILILSDIHFPFQDNEALKVAVEYGVQRQVNTVILNGDILDMYDLSRFDKEPGKAKFVNEREQFWRFMDYLQWKLPKANVYFKEGNHEERFSKYMLRKAVEIYDMDEFSLPILFNLQEFGVIWLDNKQYFKAGHLVILHGHEYYGGGANLVSPARWLFLKAKQNAIVGHFHKASSHQERDIHGNVIGTWSTGCLCQMNPRYMPLNAWSSGFAYVHVFADGTFSVKNKTIINGGIV